MIANRFYQLKAGAEPVDEKEKAEFERLLQGEKRCASARQAVLTKRAKYKTWPTRKGDHK